MLEHFDKFMAMKRQEIMDLNREILEMENDSEDELNIFENFANTKQNIRLK